MLAVRGARSAASGSRQVSGIYHYLQNTQLAKPEPAFYDAGNELYHGHLRASNFSTFSIAVAILPRQLYHNDCCPRQLLLPVRRYTMNNKSPTHKVSEVVYVATSVQKTGSQSQNKPTQITISLPSHRMCFAFVNPPIQTTLDWVHEDRGSSRCVEEVEGQSNRKESEIVRISVVMGSFCDCDRFVQVAVQDGRTRAQSGGKKSKEAEEGRDGRGTMVEVGRATKPAAIWLEVGSIFVEIELEGVTRPLVWFSSSLMDRWVVYTTNRTDTSKYDS
ncbi:hypothetical protein BDY19DRAFT_904658 [Irpex rosettiformis]|uniref:Uncharacterized protein n=1 Tax=Irpex rosettiformis TaxID=378272 RepID=A0ACB8UAH9_9APHY|nr:hypothetical protein BDY19DRAFT_904658 [Irpex rosettiformis]